MSSRRAKRSRSLVAPPLSTAILYTREKVPLSIRMLAARAAVGPDIDVIVCGDSFHFKLGSFLYLTRKGMRCSGYDVAVRHSAGLRAAGKLDRYTHTCPACKHMIYGGG